MAHGWQAIVVSQRPPLVRALPQGTEVRVIESAGWYDRFPLAQARRLLELRRIVRAVRPDVVHAYFFWSIIYARLLKLVGDISILVENREDLGFSWGRGAYAALRLLRAVPDRVICVAGAVRDVALRREAIAPARTLVIRNGIDAAPRSHADRGTARGAFGFEAEHVVVGMVANLHRAVKGGPRLLDAIGAITAAAPSARFLLAGVGTDQASLETQLRARGIADVVVGAGYRPDVETCYAAMDVSVLTSSTEGLSITLLESMRSGLPTVVTRVGGNAELVMDGVTGFLVPVDDLDAFVDRVVRLVRDAELRRSMGEAGRRRIAEHFGMDGVARGYLEVYEELLQTGVPSRRAPIDAGTETVENVE